MKRILYNICISIISILLTLIIIEGGVRYYFSDHLNYDFEMWRYAAELKEPLGDTLLPFHHKANVFGKYYGVEINTNSLGLRDVEFKIPKPLGTKRVMMLGDSFTLGWGVPFSETLAKRLEKQIATKFSNYEILNMGTGNYNSSMEVELFKRKGLTLEPNIVVLMYYINDTEPTPKISSNTYPLMKHVYLPNYVNAKLTQLSMMEGASDWLQTYYRKLYSPDSEGFRKSKDALKELIRLTADKKIKLLIVNIPDLRRLDKYPFGFATALAKEAAEKSVLPFLDLLPFFENYDGKTLWVSKDDSHMNSHANSIAAEAIFEKMIKEKMLE